MNLALSGKEDARARAGVGGSPASPASWPSPRGSATGSRSWAALCPCPCLQGLHWTRVGHRLWGGGEGLGCRTHGGTCGTPHPPADSSLTWAVPCRGGLGHEGVEGPAHDGCLLLQEAPHMVLRRCPLQLLLLLSPGAPLLLIGLQAAREQ